MRSESLPGRYTMTLSSVLSMFAKSPIRPIEEHMAKVHACVLELIPFTEALLKHDLSIAEQHQKRIMDLEHEADNLKRQLRLNLPKGIFLPVSRTDLLELISLQDAIANKTKDIAGLMLGRKMQIPSPLESIFREYIQSAVDTSAQANKAIHELDELMETSFGGSEATIVEEMITKLHQLESSSDKAQVILRQRLFAIEKNLPPVEVMFLYHIIKQIGELADIAQRVGNRLELLLAH